jgi:hypothetical protein
MFKRILAVLALAAIFAACSPSTDGGGTSPDTDLDTSPAPVESIEMSPSPS